VCLTHRNDCSTNSENTCPRRWPRDSPVVEPSVFAHFQSAAALGLHIVTPWTDSGKPIGSRQSWASEERLGGRGALLHVLYQTGIRPPKVDTCRLWALLTGLSKGR
jgi:hypothetical protein